MLYFSSYRYWYGMNTDSYSIHIHTVIIHTACTPLLIWYDTYTNYSIVFKSYHSTCAVTSCCTVFLSTLIIIRDQILLVQYTPPSPTTSAGMHIIHRNPSTSLKYSTVWILNIQYRYSIFILLVPKVTKLWIFHIHIQYSSIHTVMIQDDWSRISAIMIDMPWVQY